MLKRPMKPLFGRVVLDDVPAPPGPGPAATAESLQRAVLTAIAAHTRADGRLDYGSLRASSEWSAAVAPAGALLFLARYLDGGPARDTVAGRARPCDAYRPYDWPLQHEPAE